MMASLGDRGTWWFQWGIVGRDGFIGGSRDVMASLGDRGTWWFQWGIVGRGGFNGESWDIVASMGDRGAWWLEGHAVQTQECRLINTRLSLPPDVYYHFRRNALQCSVRHERQITCSPPW